VSDEERIRLLLELREMLKSRIERMEEALDRMRKMLRALEDVLIEMSIVSAVELAEAERRVDVQEIRYRGELVGKILIDREEGRVLFEAAEGTRLPARGTLIHGWLLRRVLEPLKERVPSVEYEVAEEGGLLKKIDVRGLDRSSLDEVVGKMRWAIIRTLRG